MKTKHPIRRFFAMALLAAVVAGLAAMPMLTSGNAGEERTASILSGTPERRTLTKQLSLGGPLTAEDAVEVTLPSGVKITEYMVHSGDRVSAGDALARVDDVSVMTAVKQVQEALDSVGKSLQTVRSKITPGVITVDSSGTLQVDGAKIPEEKIGLYAQFITLSQQHRDYAQVMLTLFLLHQNGTVTAPCGGLVGELDDSLIWKLSATGKGGLMLLSAQSKESAEPEVTEPAPTETEASQPQTEVAEEPTQPQMEPTAESTEAAASPIEGSTESQTEVAEEPTQPQTEPTAESTEAAASPTEEPTEPHTNPTEEPESTEPAPTVYSCFLRGITAIREDGMWVTRKSKGIFTVTNLTNPGNVDTTLGEQEEVISPEGPVLLYENGSWIIVEPQAGDLLLYAGDDAGGCWIIKIGIFSKPGPEEPPTEPTEPTIPNPPSGGGAGDGTGSQPSGGGMPWGDLSGMPGSANGVNPGTAFGSMGGSRSGGVQAESQYSLEMSRLCTVTPMQTMGLTLSVDEQDIGSLYIGMEAELTFEALPNRKFTAKITDISPFGENFGGSSKFQVTMELPCQEGMLPGMNAAVTIPLEIIEDCLTIPVAALAEQGTKSLVYTGCDEEKGELTNPVPVELGYSDGEYVQIISGMEVDTPFWYSYYDTVEISNAVEKKSIFG